MADGSDATKQPSIAVIFEPDTNNGKALVSYLEQLNGRAHILSGNDLASFQASPKISEVDILVFVVFAGGKVNVIEELWPHCPNVKWVHSMAAGVESLVPLMTSLDRGADIPLTNAKGAFSRSLAEYAVMAMLHFNKQVPRLQANAAVKKWDKFIMSELHGKTVGLVGFGDIAKATARLCKAFGMEIIALRNSPGAGTDGLADKVYYSGQGEKLQVFKDADFVVCSLPGGETTSKFCSVEEFAAMQSSAVFISLGRGTCVDEVALHDALANKRIAGAALDVFAVEPLPEESPLWSLDNILISSHNADLTENYIGETWRVFTQKFQDYVSEGFAGFPVTDQVDKKKGY